MLISYRWLARHVNLEGISPERLAEELTLSTAEVEGLEAFAPHLSKVTVGLVTSAEKHPDADKLTVCTVDVGEAEPLTIVCGAPNVRASLKVAVATVGTTLPGDFRIKKAKIRGVESRGMICSVRELDLGDEHDGIWELDCDLEVGKPVAEALCIEDWVIEVDNKSITHRPDLWGHRGIARELAAIFDRELLPLDTSLPATLGGEGLAVRVESAACARYIGLEIDGVRSEPSPLWLKLLLLAVGQRPLDLLVDLSNFVMLDLGQPNHLFDRTRLDPGGIVVRAAHAGETIQTLDGEQRSLTEADLLITSGDEPVALAGVMGAEASKVIGETGKLLLEVASFDAVTIRRTAARTGLRSDSSARFEKSLDPTLPMQAAGHLVRTLQAIQPEVSLPSKPVEDGDWQDPACEIELTGSLVRRLLGVELEDEAMAAILRSLDFGVTCEGDLLRVSVPSNRATRDISIDRDLVEEIGRLHRYDNIPERPLVAEVNPPPRDLRRELVTGIQDRLAGAAAFHEVMSYSFVATSLLETLGLAQREFVRLVNPVVEGEECVRRSVVPGLLKLLEKNRRITPDVRLFEIGKGYLPEEADERGLPGEIHELGLVWTRPVPGKKARFDAGLFAQMRGVLDDLIRALGFDDLRWEPAGSEAPAEPWMHAGRALCGSLVGRDGKRRCLAVQMAELEPGLQRPLGLIDNLAGEVLIGRVSLDELLLAQPRQGGFEPLPRLPGNKVDVALAMPVAISAGEVRKAIEKSGKGLCREIELFDLYSGPGLAAGTKSLAYHVLLQSDKKTITDGEAQKFFKRLERAVGELGGELRRE
ncbi:MAG TPA: phenylalanine--tRNA ligase subunit beta [Planctomycetes bacterium]|nr:phenylalanine--tRNA ligase subunit beta [Planctomycetota bacterium]HIL53131.1 phenylalanine--tRNA ligase subunit beta [Planctomycetota bacterium]